MRDTILGIMFELRFRKWLFVLLVLVAWLVGMVGLQAKRPTERRFLFIIETSAETKKCAEAIQQSMAALLDTGMGGMMQAGDTFGVWTFNKDLHLGEFPMQQWTTNTNSMAEVQSQVVEFLKTRRFEKTPKLESVVPRMMSVIQSSPTITVALFTSGSRSITNTPFDKEINGFFKEHYKDFQKDKVPFVTMLLGRDGKIVLHSVSSAFEVKVPKLPEPEPEKPVAAAAPAQVKPPEPVVPEPPRGTQALVIGKGGAQLVSATNEGVSLEEEVEKAVVAKSVPKSMPAIQAPVPEPNPVTPEQPEAPAEGGETLENKSSAPPEADVAVAPAQSNVSQAPVEHSAPVVERNDVVVDKPITAVAPSVSVETKPAPSAPMEKVQSTLVEKPTPQVAVVQVPANNQGSNNWILFVGGVLFALALMFAFWLGRSTAKPATGSLITQGVERAEKK